VITTGIVTAIIIEIATGMIVTPIEIAMGAITVIEVGIGAIATAAIGIVLDSPSVIGKSRNIGVNWERGTLTSSGRIEANSNVQLFWF
jgi:hypothetical protein